MKNILTTILVLFALGLNAQDTYSEELCDGSNLYMQFKDNYNVHIKCDIIDLNAVDFFTTNIVTNVISVTGNMAVLRIDTSQFKYQYLIAFAIKKAIEDYLCPVNEPIDTIYNYGNYSSKEVDSLEQLGNVVIESSLYARSAISFYSPTYDTVTIEGLAIYLCNEDFDTGVDFRLVPTKKVVKRDVSKYAINSYFSMNGYHVTFDKPLQVFQYLPVNGAKCHPCPNEWREVDLTKYKEFIFIEKPK